MSKIDSLFPFSFGPKRFCPFFFAIDVGDANHHEEILFESSSRDSKHAFPFFVLFTSIELPVPFYYVLHFRLLPIAGASGREYSIHLSLFVS